MRYSLFIPLFACFATSVSCGPMYKNPPKDPAKTATLRSNETRSGLYTWANHTVEAIDNLPVNYAASWTSETKEIVVTSGVHELVMGGTFNRGFLAGGPYSARGDLRMNFKPGRNYKANGRVEGSKLAMWIEDTETSQPVSETIRIPYQFIPQTTYTPIFIPAN